MTEQDLIKLGNRVIDTRGNIFYFSNALIEMIYNGLIPKEKILFNKDDVDIIAFNHFSYKNFNDEYFILADEIKDNDLRKNEWFYPEKYDSYDLQSYFDFYTKDLPSVYKERADIELKLYKEHNMEKFLRFCIYFADVMAQENFVIGVGRGSSSASLLLYLLKIHLIDPIKYNLDIKEFIKDSVEGKYNIADLDIDTKNREEVLKYFKYIPASKIGTDTIVPHGVGVYFCNIKKDLLSGLASIDYKVAEEQHGYMKIDLLRNSVYDNFYNRSDIYLALQQPIFWQLLKDQNVVEKLPHIGTYYTLLNQMPEIDSVEDLAKFIAIIRPGKKHLIDKVKSNNNWECIDDEIWLKPSDGQYYYKKTHSISYALMITLLLR